jgi:hypothetical protein
MDVHEGDQVSDGPFRSSPSSSLARNAFMLGSLSNRVRLAMVVK